MLYPHFLIIHRPEVIECIMLSTFSEFTKKHSRLAVFIIVSFLFGSIVFLFYTTQNFSSRSGVGGDSNTADVLDGLTDEGVEVEFVEYRSTQIEGFVVEMSETESFIRVYNSTENLVHTIFVSTSTIITDVNNTTMNIGMVEQGSAVIATAHAEQDALDFNADTIKITNQVSLPMVPMEIEVMSESI